VHSPTQTQNVTTESSQINAASNLPESPPDSGSEPPYSPNIKAMDHMQQQQQHQQQGALSMGTLTELHVPHHHNLLTPATELYLSHEHQHQQQQLLQINNLLQKHDSTILPPPAQHPQHQQDHQMMLYQVNQNGQIIELNHIHQQHQQQSQNMTSRLYKGRIGHPFKSNLNRI
jgi:hypothetical protein